MQEFIRSGWRRFWRWWPLWLFLLPVRLAEDRIINWANSKIDEHGPAWIAAVLSYVQNLGPLGITGLILIGAFVSSFALAAIGVWRQRHHAAADAIEAQTAELRLARALQSYASDPAVKAFNETRTNDIRSGADIGELPLGVAVHIVVTNSAWGRFQAAQHHVEVGDQQVIKMAESYFLFDFLQKGRIATRGHRNGDVNNYEFISPDWWGRFFFRLEHDSRQIYKAIIYPRNEVDVRAHPSYTGICCEWGKVRALFPERDEEIDAKTAELLAKRDK